MRARILRPPAANAKRGYRPDGTDLQASLLLSPAISIQGNRRAFL
jgi:hypothetical protein